MAQTTASLTSGDGNPTRSIVNDRICRVATYVEPDVADIIDAQAKHSGDTVSAWLRKIILDDLINKGLINAELLRKLATR